MKSCVQPISATLLLNRENTSFGDKQLNFLTGLLLISFSTRLISALEIALKTVFFHFCKTYVYAVI